jgi:hypothetical protein
MGKTGPLAQPDNVRQLRRNLGKRSLFVTRPGVSNRQGLGPPFPFVYSLALLPAVRCSRDLSSKRSNRWGTPRATSAERRAVAT